MIKTSAVGLTIRCLVATGRPNGWSGAGRRPVGPTDTLVYVGTYTGGKTNSQGIFAFKMARGSTALLPLGLAAETVSPTFIEIDPDRGLLFAVNEVDQYEGKPTGSVSAFSIDRKTGKLTLINLSRPRARRRVTWRSTRAAGCWWSPTTPAAP